MSAPDARISLTNVTLATLDAAGCDTRLDQPLILIDAPAQKLTLAQAAELHGRLGALLAEHFAAMLASFRSRAARGGRIEHSSPLTDRAPDRPRPPGSMGVPPVSSSRVPPASDADIAAAIGAGLPVTIRTRDGRRTRRLKPRGTALGLRLTRERAARGWTQAELARRATARYAGPRIYPNYISEIESGRRAPTPAQLRAMERAMKLPPGDLEVLAQQLAAETHTPKGSEAPIQKSV